MLLAGDAASLVDPIYGYGIEPAVDSGRLAGSAARLICEDGGNASAHARHYEDEVYRLIGRQIGAVAKFVSPIFRDRPDMFFSKFIEPSLDFGAYATGLSSLMDRVGRSA